MKKIYVSDATLRVLCNGKGDKLSFRQRLSIALSLEKTGVDAIELPALTAGKEAEVICRTIASAVKCRVCVPCDSEEAIEKAAACLKAAANPCIQIMMPVSTVQMEYMYHVKAEKMLARVAQLCRKAKAVCPNVEFVARDATRAETGFAARCCAVACDSGADMVTLCDDSSLFFPEELAALVEEVKAACGAAVCAEPGNGLNMAAACAVQALRGGADGVKTVTGGQGLSSDALADILRARGDAMGVAAKLDVTAIASVLRSLDGSAAAPTQEGSAQPLDEISLACSATLTDVAAAVGSLGYELSDEDMGKVYQEFRRVSRKKASIGTRELEAVIATAAMQVPSTYHLVSYVVNSGNVITATAHVTLEKDGQKLSGVSTGDGPIDAAFHAIEQIIGHHYELDDFQVQAVTKGREAVGSSIIRLRAEGRLYSGNGISTDVVGACIRAYINALNKIVYEG